jgi:hypothetical protein
MTRKPKPRAGSAVKRNPAPKKSPRRRIISRRRRADPLDRFIAAAAHALDLPVQKKWLPAIKANLRVTLQHAATVAAFELPDDAEPAPVFRA